MEERSALAKMEKAFCFYFCNIVYWVFNLVFLFSKRSDKIIGSSGEKEKIASDGILINYEKNKLSESDGFLWDALKRRSDRFFEERSSSSELTRLALVSRFRERLKEPLFRENILIDISKNKNILFDPNNRKWKELWLSGDFDRCLQELNRLEVESESNWTFLFFPAEYYHSSILTLYLFEFGPGDPSVFDNLNDIYLYLQKNPSLRKFAPDIELHLLACELIYEKQSSDVSLNELFESDPLLGDRIDRLLSTFYF